MKRKDLIIPLSVLFMGLIISCDRLPREEKVCTRTSGDTTLHVTKFKGIKGSIFVNYLLVISGDSIEVNDRYGNGEMNNPGDIVKWSCSDGEIRVGVVDEGFLHFVVKKPNQEYEFVDNSVILDNLELQKEALQYFMTCIKFSCESKEHHEVNRLYSVFYRGKDTTLWVTPGNWGWKTGLVYLLFIPDEEIVVKDFEGDEIFGSPVDEVMFITNSSTVKVTGDGNVFFGRVKVDLADESRDYYIGRAERYFGICTNF